MNASSSSALIVRHVSADPSWPSALVMMAVWGLLAAGGTGWTRKLLPDFKGPERTLAGMLAGWSLPGLAVTAGLALGWDVRGAGVTGLWAAPLLAGLLFFFRGGEKTVRARSSGVGWQGRLLPLATAGITGALWARLIWPEPWSGMSGEGIYGYRAKLWMLTGGQPPGYESAPGYDFSYPSYPPCFSGALFAASLVTGRLQDHWGALFPALPGAALVWCACRRLLVGGAGLPGCVAVAAFAACQQVTRTVTWFYPEPVLAGGLVCAAGFFAAARGEQARRLALGGALVLAVLCWWKNDGLVFWLSGALWLALARPMGWGRAAALTAPVATGWRVWLAARGGSDPDFDWLQPWREGISGALERLSAVGGAFWDEALAGGRDYAFVWWWGPPVLAAALVCRRTGGRWLGAGVFLTASVTAGLSAVFLFSVLPATEHLVVYWRLLAAPSWLLLVTAGRALCEFDERKGHESKIKINQGET